MASKQTLIHYIEVAQARVEKAKASVERVQKKIAKVPERVKKGKLTDNERWDLNYNNVNHLSAEEFLLSQYNEELEDFMNRLSSAESELRTREEELKQFEEKAASRNIKPILDFLELWKEKVRKHCIDNCELAKALRKDIKETLTKRILTAYPELGGDDFHSKHEFDEKFKQCKRVFVNNGEPEGYWAKKECAWVLESPVWKDDAEKKELLYEFHRLDEVESILDGIPCGYNRYKGTIDMDILNKFLQQEADAKYDFIIERTNKIVGQITDASNLRIGEKGELNGIICGTRGNAYVNTIGAGGYNIQCFHFRTLINPYKG